MPQNATEPAFHNRARVVERPIDDGTSRPAGGEFRMRQERTHAAREDAAIQGGNDCHCTCNSRQSSSASRGRLGRPTSIPIALPAAPDHRVSSRLTRKQSVAIHGEVCGPRFTATTSSIPAIGNNGQLPWIYSLIAGEIVPLHASRSFSRPIVHRTCRAPRRSYSRCHEVSSAPV